MPENNGKSAQHKALVLGVNGQDGSFIAEYLLAKGYQVKGVGRQISSRWVSAPNFEYLQLDLSDLEALALLLSEYRPDRIYNFAAVHGSSGFRYENAGRDTHIVNTLTVQVILDFIVRQNPLCRLVYPSSAKTFGAQLPHIIDDDTTRVSECLYSIAKNTSRDLIRYYRKHHGVFSSVVTLFNHESSRRQADYFVPTLVDHAAKALVDPGYRGSVHSLGMSCDWGDAKEYAALIVAAGELDEPYDFNIATGTCRTGEDLASDLFSALGLTHGNHLFETSPHQSKTTRFRVDTDKLEQLLWVPRDSILDVCMNILKTNHPEAWAKKEPKP